METDEPVVAFTFDDGPGPRWTPTVLDALEEWKVPATFFTVGLSGPRYDLGQVADWVAWRDERNRS